MAFATVDQLSAFVRVHFGTEVASVFQFLSKNCKSTLQIIVQQFRVSSEKNYFFPAENFAMSSALKIKKYFEKTIPAASFEAMTSNGQVLKMVQQCLTVLLNHDMVALSRRRSDGAIEYSVNWPQARVLLRAPAYLCLVRTQLGHVAELLLEELLFCGRVGLLPCLATVAKRLQEEDGGDNGAATAGDPGVRALKAFAELLERRLIVRRGSIVPPPVASDSAATAASDDDEGVADGCRVDKPFAPISRAEREAALQHLQLALSPKSEESAAEPQPPPAKRSRLDPAASAAVVADGRRADEAAQEFSANAEELRRQWRDSMLARAAIASSGPAAGRVLAAMLAAIGERVRLGQAQSPESEVLAHADIGAQLAASGDSRAALDLHLTALADDGLIERLSGVAGGQFRVRYRDAVFALTRQSVAAVVRQRVSDKAVRVFNALYDRPNLTQSELESHTLLAGRDCKELLYRLLVDGFVHCVELTRSAADFMNPRPNTAFYLFNVNLEQTVRKLLLAMQAHQDRLLTRRLTEAAANRRLLEKHQRVKELLKNLDAQAEAAASSGQPVPPELADQKAQAAQLVTPPEREQLQALKRSRTVLRAGELLLEENIFLFQLFLDYASGRS